MSIGGQFASTIGGSMIQGAGTAAAAAGIAGVGLAANNVYNAVTKARDFKSMLASPFNEDLKDHYLQDPRRFNAAFTSIRSMTPEFSKDPIIAGNYMRQMMTGGDMSAGGTLVGALREQPKDTSPIHKMVADAGVKGIEGGQGITPRDMWSAHQKQQGPKEGPKFMDQLTGAFQASEGADKAHAARLDAEARARQAARGGRRRP